LILAYELMGACLRPAQIGNFLDAEITEDDSPETPHFSEEGLVGAQGLEPWTR